MLVDWIGAAVEKAALMAGQGQLSHVVPVSVAHWKVFHSKPRPPKSFPPMARGI
jgi:hypothetical protein